MRISNEPGEKERERERKREKKMPFIVANYVYASSQGQRTHSARTNYTICKKPSSSQMLDWYFENFGNFTTSNVDKAKYNSKGCSKIFFQEKCDEMDKIIPGDYPTGWSIMNDTKLFARLGSTVWIKSGGNIYLMAKNFIFIGFKQNRWFSTLLVYVASFSLKIERTCLTFSSCPYIK